MQSKFDEHELHLRTSLADVRLLFKLSAEAFFGVTQFPSSVISTNDINWDFLNLGFVIFFLL